MSFRPDSASVSCLPEGAGVMVSGGVVICGSELQLHFVVADANLECVTRRVGGKGAWLPCRDVEQRAMPWALHGTGRGVELPLGERTVVVRAAILDRVALAVGGVEDADLAPVSLDQAHLALRQVG